MAKAANTKKSIIPSKPRANTMYSAKGLTSTKKKKLSNPNAKNYCDKELMLAELVRYHKTSVMSEELGRMFMDIAKKLANNWRFFKYSDKEDMINSCIARMVKQVDKYDINHPKRNPFWYFSQLAYYQIIGEIKKLNKERGVKKRIANAYVQELVHSSKIRSYKQKTDMHEDGWDHDNNDNILNSIEEHDQKEKEYELAGANQEY